MINVNSKDDLEEKVPLHLKWLLGEEGGERLVCAFAADLSGADLSGADLGDANLGNADLRGAILRGANLSDANLSDTILNFTDLSFADLRGAIIPFSAHIDKRGYTFSWSFGRNKSNELMFCCGCRCFSYEQAKSHWLADDYHDKDLGAAKMKVVDFIKEMFESGMLLVKPGVTNNKDLRR